MLYFRIDQTNERTHEQQHEEGISHEDFIANWIDMKQKEYDALRLRSHLYEFAMYYDV